MLITKGLMRWKKWNKLKLAPKSKVDASHREASRTGSGSNSVGVVQDSETLILSADKTLINSEIILQMFESNPSFSGFQAQ